MEQKICPRTMLVLWKQAGNVGADRHRVGADIGGNHSQYHSLGESEKYTREAKGKLF